MPLLASIDPFLELVVKSGLLTPDQLTPFRTGSRATLPPARDETASRLIETGLLTPYQARLLLNGWYRGFFIDDKYKILDLLGEGGMGRVYLCEHLVLQRLVAVKQLQIGSEAIPGANERLLREAVAVATLDHLNIARIHDADRCVDRAFLVMESIDGVNLHQLTAHHGQLPVGRAADLIRQAALGLHHAYERGLVHRDVKPGNLMVDRCGTVKILDMGLARFFDANRNQNLTNRFDSRRALGTAEFMAPEQAVNSSEVDTRADIYSLGGTLYFLLLGRFPYQTGTALEKLYRHQSEPFDAIAQQRPEVPAGLIDVINLMVAKRPQDRFPNPAAVAAALAPYSTDPEPLRPEEKPLPPTYQLGLCPPPNESLIYGSNASGVDHTPVGGLPHLSTSVSPTFQRTETFAPLTDSPDHPVTVSMALAHLPTARTLRAGTTRFERAVIPAAVVLFISMVTLVAGIDRYKRAGRGVAGLPGEPVVAPAGPARPLSAGGATLAEPLFDVWAVPTVSYRPVGSPRGIGLMTERVLDFAVTCVPLADEHLAAAGGPVEHVPVAVTGVAVCHNLPGQPQPLRFTGPVLADIFLGNITDWADPRIRANNPGVALPELPIVVVRRKDDAGTTLLFTDYLSRVSSRWASCVGVTPGPKWPAPSDPNGRQPKFATGDSGVARTISQTTGAIGFLNATQALAVGLPLDLIQNDAGRYLSPTSGTLYTTVSRLAAEMPDDPRAWLVNAPGADSYPVTSLVWAVAHRRQRPETAEALRQQFLMMAGTDPSLLETLGYAPLPDPLRRRVLARIEQFGRD